MFASQIPTHKTAFTLSQALTSKTEDSATFTTAIYAGVQCVCTMQSTFYASGEIEHDTITGAYPESDELTEELENIVSMYAGSPLRRNVFLND